MKFDYKWLVIILLVIAVIVTAVAGHKSPVQPVVSPSPVLEVVNPSPAPTVSPEPSASPTPTVQPSASPSVDPIIDNIKPDPTSAIIIIEDFTEADKRQAFANKGAKFIKELEAEGLVVETDIDTFTVLIFQNLTDEEVKEFAKVGLPYNEIIKGMLDQAFVKEIKTEMFLQHLVIGFRHNEQIIAAYDVIADIPRDDLIEAVG